ncbi:MAG: nitroreductase family protein [Ilumatobacteraceae bacterium]
MTHLGLSADELLTTTRTVRKRLDLDRPVDRAVVLECLTIALQAPTASNDQPWRWVLVDDPSTKRDIQQVYAKRFAGLRGRTTDAAGGPSGLDPVTARMLESAAHLADNLHRVPLLVVPCAAGRPGPEWADAAAYWGMMLPAVWSFMLALRERALGSAWTTLHLRDGGDREVAALLGIPHDGYAQVGLLPVAHTVGVDFRPAQRPPVESVVHWDRWGNPPG